MRLNKNPLAEIPFNNFGGGYAGAKGSTSLGPNEALDVDNIIILPTGAGIRNRQGNKEYYTGSGSSAPIGPIQGLQTFKTSSAEYMIWVASQFSNNDVNVFTTDLSSANKTLRYTIVSHDGDQNEIFTIFRLKNLAIGVGAHLDPWKIDFSSGSPASGAVLGGTPPLGTVGLAWNNVAWIGNTTSNPSKLSYSILNDPTDWTSSGSGFVEPQPGDGDEITALMPISNNILLLFKNRSVFQVTGRADPFAVFPLFDGVGCVGKHAIVSVDGLVYFITPQGQMLITDGNYIYNSNQTVKYSYAKDIPQLDFANDLWSQIPVSRLPYIQGFREQGINYDHIVWMVSLGTGQTTNNHAIVWDLKNKCWLRHSKGFNGNISAKTSDNKYYIGGYSSGRWYQLDYPGKYDDDSEGTPQTNGSNAQVIPPLNLPVNRWLWRTDDISLNSLENIVQVDRINVLTQYASNGTLSISYGYDGFRDQDAKNVSVISSTFVLSTSVLGVDSLGGLRFDTKSIRPLGRGNTFNMQISGTDAVAAEVTKFTLSGRQAATKVSGVR